MSQKFLGCQDPSINSDHHTHLARLLRLLLELLDGSLVNTTALVDHMTCSGGLARVDMADNDNVDMGLFLSHLSSSSDTILK